MLAEKRHPQSIRKDKRILVFLKWHNDYAIRCETANIARGGILAEGDDLPFGVDDEIEMIFPRPEGNVVWLKRFRGVVTRIEKEGVAVRFLKKVSK